MSDEQFKKMLANEKRFMDRHGGRKPPKNMIVSRTQGKATVGMAMHPNCNAPFGLWDKSISACECQGKWYGDNCQNKHCADYNETAGNPDCSGHGMCLKGECFCAAGWGKKLGNLGLERISLLQNVTEARVFEIADSNVSQVGGNVCLDPVCPIDCGAHGMCQDNLCVCQDGWKGPACREPKCTNDCSGHGTCTFMLPNSPGECNCQYGFSGNDCNHVAFYQKLTKCPNDCSGNGLCMNGKCACQPGSFGVDCNQVACAKGTTGPNCEFKQCPSDCNGNGACNKNGKCACKAAYTAVDCSIPVKCFEACHTVCLPSLKSQRCEVCKGNCLTLSINPVIGHHNPMSARLNTLQKTAQVKVMHRHHKELSAVSVKKTHHHHKEVSVKIVNMV